VRRHFVASDASEPGVHDHVAWCGEGPVAFVQVAVSAFRAAAQRGEKLLLVAEHADVSRLHALGDVEALMRQGSLEIAAAADAYGEVHDSYAQREEFEGRLDRAMTDGYSGLCVVADNSGPVSGTDAAFDSWLTWEATADQLQSTRPITGICYFDRRAVPDDRLVDLASVHPVLSAGVELPVFQLFADGDAVRLVGEVDTLCAARLRRLLAKATSASEGRLALDLSEVDFIDHGGMLALEEIAREHGGLQARGARGLVRRVWQLLDVPAPALELI